MDPSTIEPAIDPAILDLPQKLVALYRDGGWLVIAALTVWLVVWFFRTEFMQRKLFVWLRWTALAEWQRWLIVVGLSYADAAIHAVAGAATWRETAWGGIVAALGAMGVRATQKVFTPNPVVPDAVPTRLKPDAPKPAKTEFPSLPSNLPDFIKTPPIE